MKILQLDGSYHQKPIDVYMYSPKQHTNVVTIVCKGLYGVFDPTHTCGVNLLGDMLITHNTSHVVFYNSSRDFRFTVESSFESRRTAFSDKTFKDELDDLQTVVQYMLDHVQEIFSINSPDLVLYVHGTSIGGTIALMATAEYLQIRKLSLCAPPSNKGNSEKPIVSTMPASEKLFFVASQFTGDMFLLYGGNDVIVPKESSFAIINHAHKARTATSLVIPDADHNFRMLNGIETPDAHKAFATALFDFLSNHVIIE